MKILTVRQPWAWAIIHGGKDVENRTTNIAGSYRGPVAIHVSKTDAENAPDALWLEHAEFYRQQKRILTPDWSPEQTDRGAIIGVVDLAGVHVGGEWDDDYCFRAPAPGEPEVISIPRCSPWAQTGAYHLVLENPRALAAPIPFKGALGLRELDAATEALVWEGLE